MNGNDIATDPELLRLMGELAVAPKVKIAVRRAQPKWCARYLGTIDVEVFGDFSLDTIREAFGGGTFYFKFKDPHGRYLAHRTARISGVPLENGLPIPRSEIVAVANDPPDADDESPPCECADLRREIAALTARIGRMGERQAEIEIRQRRAEQLAQEVIAEVRRNDAASRTSLAIAKAREAKEARWLRMAVLIAGMVWLARSATNERGKGSSTPVEGPC
jgi:hypothetical protein